MQQINCNIEYLWVTTDISFCWTMLFSIPSALLSILISVYSTWAFAALVFNVLECLYKLLGFRIFSRFCEGPTSYTAKGKEVVIATQINRDTTFPQVQKKEWYSLCDITSRISLALTAFIFALLSRPFTLVRYTFIFYKTFSGRSKAVLSVLLLPFWPITMFLNTLIFNNLSFLPMLNVNDDQLESLQFFTNSLSATASVLYDFSQELSNYIGNFYILGPCEEAIQTMYWDTEKTTKVFWRKQLSDVGARIPGEVGIWNGVSLEWKEDIKQYNSLCIKVTDSCMGIGDLFLKRYRDYNSYQDVEQIFRTKYLGKPCLLIEFITAHPDLGVHSLDILTARDPAGEVQLVDIVVWAGSASETSHGATDCYMMDPRSGVTCNFGKWYNPNFMKTSPAGLNKYYPGVSDAVLTALQAHKNLPFSWLNVVGWDCMVTEQSDIVFFEGNLAAWRCPRRLFLSLGNFIYFVSYISWIGNN